MNAGYGERQFYNIKKYALSEGKSNGVRCIDIDTGDLEFTLIVDRCLDIAGVKYRGKQFAFLSSNGIVAPCYYDPTGSGWLRSFGGGLLATCGFQNAGDPCEFDGIDHGLHGRISNTPAENVAVNVNRQSDEIQISGVVREMVLMGCNYELQRSIATKIGGNIITVHDNIKNLSDVPQPLMLLYHLNFGYPLLNPDAKLTTPGIRETIPYDAVAEKGLAEWHTFTPPAPGAPEEVFLHKFNVESNAGEFSLQNRANNPQMSIQVSYSAKSLPYLALWKSLRSGEYAAALEPCNNHLRGLAHESKLGHLRWLQPGETEETFIEFRFEMDQ